MTIIIIWCIFSNSFNVFTQQGKYLIKIHVPLAFPSIAPIPFNVLLLASANLTLNMWRKMTIAIFRVRYFLLLENRLAEAIFDKKICKSCFKSPNNVCSNEASELKWLQVIIWRIEYWLNWIIIMTKEFIRRLWLNWPGYGIGNLMEFRIMTFLC